MDSRSSISLICNVISSTVFSVPRGGETAGSIAYNGGSTYGGETAGSVACSSTGGSCSTSTSSSCGSFSAIA